MKSKITVIIVTVLLLIIGSCEKQDRPNMNTLEYLYDKYKNGEIDQCKLNGEIVFCVGLNYVDAGAYIYSNNGERIGECNYAWGPVDKICKELTDCEVIYRCDNHITGEPPINKYNLSD